MAQQETLTIRGKEHVVKREEIDVGNLRFYLENPRVYESVRVEIIGSEPTQDEIKNALIETEDVKTLKKEIKDNGGLIDPVIVRRDNFQVIEGNRRLAAYLELNRENPSEPKWKKIKCTVIQEVTESDINAILGQYHLKGKKEWKPYEQASFIYRRNKNDQMSINKISAELGITNKKVQDFIKVYEFMKEHGESKNPDRWSYYYSYLSLRARRGRESVNDARNKYSNMDELIVKKIRTKEIKTATELRDKLPHIVTNKKAFKDFIKENSTFEKAWERVKESGSADNYVVRINSFCAWAADNLNDMQKAIQQKDGIGKKLHYQIKQLQRLFNKFK